MPKSVQKRIFVAFVIISLIIALFFVVDIVLETKWRLIASNASLISKEIAHFQKCNLNRNGEYSRRLISNEECEISDNVIKKRRVKVMPISKITYYFSDQGVEHWIIQEPEWEVLRGVQINGNHKWTNNKYMFYFLKLIKFMLQKSDTPTIHIAYLLQ